MAYLVFVCLSCLTVTLVSLSLSLSLSSFAQRLLLACHVDVFLLSFFVLVIDPKGKSNLF